jgi:hypothetical protein
MKIGFRLMLDYRVADTSSRLMLARVIQLIETAISFAFMSFATTQPKPNFKFAADEFETTVYCIRSIQYNSSSLSFFLTRPLTVLTVQFRSHLVLLISSFPRNSFNHDAFSCTSLPPSSQACHRFRLPQVSCFDSRSM